MDTTSVGQIGLDLTVNEKNFNSQLTGIQKKAEKAGKKIATAFSAKLSGVGKACNDLGSDFKKVQNSADETFANISKGISGFAKNAIAKLAAAFAVKKLVDFGKECIELGSDLAEVQNVVDVTFPNMTKRIDDFAKNAASKFGLSETMAKKYSGTLGSMAEAFGFSESAAADMATTLTGLAGDVASFYNISQDEAYTKIKSVFTGETESLKELGVVMTQTALDQYALANGYGKVTAKMTEAEKVSLRYAFVQDQLTNAAGDFARTSDSWANQVRILSLQFDSLRASIGQGLINVFLPVIRLINQLIGRLQTAAKAFANFTSLLGGKTASNMDAVTQSAKTMGGGISAASDAATGISSGMGKAAKAAKIADKAAKSLKRTLEGFDQITKLSEKDKDTGSKNKGTGSGKSGGTSLPSSMPTDITATGEQAEKTAGKVSKLFEPLMASIGRLKKSFGDFCSTVGSVFKGIYENILKPFGKWTISKLAPKLVDILAAAFDVLTAVIEALKPAGKWLWDNFLSKIAKFAGDAILGFLDLFAKGLKGLADWINKHPDLFEAFAGGLVAAFGALQALKIPSLIQGVIRSVQPMGKIFTKVSGIISKLGGVIGFITSPIGIAVLAIGGLVAAGILLYKNWDKVKKYAKKLGDSLKKSFKQIKENVGQNIDRIVTKFKNIPKKIKEIFKKKMEGVSEWFGGIKESFDNTLKKLGEKLPDLSGIPSAVSDAIGEIRAKIVGWFADKKEDLKQKWEQLTEGIQEKTISLKAKAETKKEEVKSWWEGVCDWWKDKEAKLKAAAATGAAEVKKWWAETSADWKEKIANLKAKAETTAANVQKWWSDTVSGWKDKASSLKMKAETTAVSIKDWWSSRAREWKDKSSGFKVKVETAIDTIKDKWNKLQSQWKDKTANFRLNFNAKVSDFKAWANKNIIDKINGKFKNIPILRKIKIPHLAEGGFVKKNTPQLAMIGDNRHQGEIVAPESKLEAMAREAAGSNNNQRVIELLEQIVQLLIQLLAKDTDLYIDGELLTRKILATINKIRVRTGKNPITL